MAKNNKHRPIICANCKGHLWYDRYKKQWISDNDRSMYCHHTPIGEPLRLIETLREFNERKLNIT